MILNKHKSKKMVEEYIALMRISSYLTICPNQLNFLLTKFSIPSFYPNREKDKLELREKED